MLHTVEIFATGVEDPSDQCPEYCVFFNSACSEAPGAVLRNPTEGCCSESSDELDSRACNISCLSQCVSDWPHAPRGSQHGGFSNWWYTPGCRQCGYTVHSALFESSVQAAALLVGTTDALPCETPHELSLADLLSRERYPELNWAPCSPDLVTRIVLGKGDADQAAENARHEMCRPSPATSDLYGFTMPDEVRQAIISDHARKKGAMLCDAEKNVYVDSEWELEAIGTTAYMQDRPARQ